MRDEERLRAELGELLPPLAAPEVDPLVRERVLTAVATAANPQNHWADNWWWQLARAQMRVVRQEIWWASLLVMGLGVLVSLLMRSIDVPSAQPFVMIAPLVTAVGIAFLYGDTRSGGLWEMESVTAVAPRTILLIRLFILFGFDLLLGVLGSGLLALLLPSLSWWGLVMMWLAPMTFLTALALLIAVLTHNPELGMLVSFLIWVGHSYRMQTGRDLFHNLPILTLPDLTAPANQPFLWVLAFLFTAVAIWQADQERAFSAE